MNSVVSRISRNVPNIPHPFIPGTCESHEIQLSMIVLCDIPQLTLKRHGSDLITQTLGNQRTLWLVTEYEGEEEAQREDKRGRWGNSRSKVDLKHRCSFKIGIAMQEGI